MRLQFHSQLSRLWTHDPLLSHENVDALPEGTVRGDRMVEVLAKGSGYSFETLFFYVAVGGYRFIPLITRRHGLRCNLAITMLRTEEPGGIIHGGDLDNRLKTLFDALRIPYNTDELGGHVPTTPAERCFCLMDDDALISRLSVDTGHLLAPPVNQDETYVELDLHVTAEPVEPIIGNAGW